MLIKFFKRIVARAGSRDDRDPAQLLQQAHEIALAGDNRGAIKAYREVLEREPANIEAINGLGACLAYVGNTAEAARTFELAYSLDDTYIPAMVNHGKLLIDDNKADEGLGFIRRAKICAPDFAHADAVYAGLCLRLGDPGRARRHQLKSWLANFDNLRLANCYLFWTSYDDVDEALIAAEHRFWAETLSVPPVKPEGELAALPEPPGPGGRRIRLGFWSPDFRGHSVRYFFRPLLDALDRERFETFLYHDAPGRDGHTDAVQARADHFHDCAELTDADLHELVRSHQLDILVELAGHSSHNRVSLLAHRLATVQVTGLGYPPTDGLRTVDAKLVDRHVVTPDSARYFAEEPVALATSFWCFDPKEPIGVAAEPPVVKNGHVTFACMGNIAKISPPLARCWVEILAAVPDSRLLIRSISFEDPLAERSFARQLADWGLPMDRVDLRRPEGGVRFFASYDEVDIILDTFPFNGGTTTCFATYMGVPVVSLVGESLVGRMGLSILSNAGEPGLAVRTLPEYTAKAVAVARDVDFLRRYKTGIRERLARTALGNETLHAREFEQVCLALLERRRAGTLQWQPRIDTLPSAEIMRRAYGVLRRGNEAAARRIVDHCLREYPHCGAAHLLVAQMTAWQQRLPDAVAYLQERVQAFSTQDQVSTWLSIARMQLLQDHREQARQAVGAALALPQADAFEADQGLLLQAALAPAEGQPGPPGDAPARAVRVLVPCDDASRFKRLRDDLLQTLVVPEGWSLDIQRCGEARRLAAYRASMDVAGWDVLVLLQKNVRVASPLFLVRAAGALAQADVVGFAGATRWSRVDWRNDAFEAKAGAFIGTCVERAGWAELQLVGHGREALHTGMAVLDGGALVLSRQVLAAADWDEELLGGETLLEEAWVHAAGRAGARLAVHRGLGVEIDATAPLDASNRAEASVRCAELLGIDPFEAVQDDFLALAVPAPDARHAAAIADRYLGLA